MKIKILSIAAALMLIVSCQSLQNTNKTQRGTAIGAAGGAILGAIIGNNVGDGANQTEGAVIGAVVGGVAGNVIGRKMDKQAEEISQEIPGAQVERVGEGIVVTFNEGSGINFATNQSSLNASSRATLDKLVKVMNDYEGTEILVSGHTDNAGDASYNMELSKKRAFAVRDYLVTDGIAKDRMAVTYAGETNPVSDNSTAAGRAENRRVEIGIVAGEEMRRNAENEVKG